MNARTQLIIPEVVEVSALGVRTRAEMYELYARHYEASDFARFQLDLDDKHFVVLLHDEAEALQGFSTIAAYERDFAGRRIGVLFSGDTVIDAQHWGQQALAFAWLRFAGMRKALAPRRQLYWFLISKGHRTYRFLTAFAHAFWPAYDRPTPAAMQSLMHMLARERFGSAYDEASGLIRFTKSLGHLSPAYAIVSEAHRRKPEVDFFLARNPGYAHGDELVCLCELSADNLRPMARRVFCSEMLINEDERILV
ncbi:MAG: hypothetical protein ACRECQ_13270 [Burkholderiaceae bacterium]